MLRRFRIPIVLAVAAALMALSISVASAQQTYSCDFTSFKAIAEEIRKENGIERWDRRNPDHTALIRKAVAKWMESCED